MAKSFSLTIDNWVKKTEGRAILVFHESAAGLAFAAMQPQDEGGNMPVKTGNLRNSLAASRQGVPPVKWRGKKADGTHTKVTFADNGFQLQSEITAAAIGDTIYLGFQAPYAYKAERANGFVRLAAQRWPQIVEEAIASVSEQGGPTQSRPTQSVKSADLKAAA